MSARRTLAAALAAAALGLPATASGRGEPRPPTAPTPPDVQGACLPGNEAGMAQDGRTDDTAAFERAFARVASRGGGCLSLTGHVAVCDAVLRGSGVTVLGTNEYATYLVPTGPTCGLVHFGDGSTPANGVWFERVGFVQPVPGRQVAGTFVSFDNAYASGLQRFYVRNAWDAFRLGPRAGNVSLSHGNVRTVANDLAVVDGSNDQYFDHVVADYDGETDGVRGNSRSCFDVRSSRGSLVITDGDFIHCGTPLRLAPRAGAVVSWTFVSNTAFDTCTSAYTGSGILIAPEGRGPDGKPSVVEGLKLENSWSSGCDRGVLSSPTGGAYAQAISFVGLTAQGNSMEAVLLQGDTRSVTFVAPEMFRNSARTEGRYATVRVAAGVGNVSFLGGKVGGIDGEPLHVARWGIELDPGYAGTATVVGTDLCGFGAGGSGLRVAGQDVLSSTKLPGNVTVVGVPCARR